MSAVGTVHFVTALAAILSGAIVLLLPKGTRWHRTWGHAYVWSMVGVVATSFAMYDLTGSFTPFHLAALVAGVTVGGGMNSVLRRVPRGGWIDAHAWWMSGSYLGLVAAFAAESLTRFVMPMAASYLTLHSAWGAFWALVAVASFGTGGVGWWIMKTRVPGAIRSTPAAMRAEREELAGR